MNAAAPHQAPDPLGAFNKVLGHTTIKYLDRARAYPFLKWVGGKRALVPEIVKVLPVQFNTYWEPFTGGGAVFFALDSRIRQAQLSDLNMDLMITYQVVKENPDGLIELLRQHEQSHAPKYYAKVRKAYNIEPDAVRLAAQFIYLNKTGFNGLYRVNKAGKFNVPCGSYKNPKICDEPNIRAVSKVLQTANLTSQSFADIEPQSGDLVYCDPPYDGTFTNYNGGGFTEDDQRELATACIQWRRQGVHVIASNSDTPLVRSIYRDFIVHEVSAPRNVSCNGNGRGKETELLIVG